MAKLHGYYLVVAVAALSTIDVFGGGICSGIQHDVLQEWTTTIVMPFLDVSTTVRMDVWAKLVLATMLSFFTTN